MELESTNRVMLKLKSGDNSASIISFEDGNDAEMAAIAADFDNSPMLRIYTDNAGGEIGFETGTQAEAMRIESSGDVGIGTTVCRE